ncbi:hypothetical protein [Bacillus sp. 3255]|uniref:hypothetical protein n=1 Tax=Bacillus sp. 3255 TaxID=2817904 RepID=UPI002859857F|nr:hypothetical protein [Bacillus sp. 3255]MDR6883061.1 hypothetical protein [Bacillus sp. 3255]
MKAIIQRWENDNWYKGMLNEQFFVEPAGTSHYYVRGKGVHAGKTIKSEHCDIVILGTTLSEMVGNIEVLEEERVLLLKQIERELERQKPVVIPLDVADAIEYFRSCGYRNIDFVKYLFGVERDGFNQQSLTIKEFIHDNGGGDLFLKALVNDYTIETLESKIEAAIRAIHKEWKQLDFPDVQESDEHLTKCITERVSEIIREDHATQ